MVHGGRGSGPEDGAQSPGGQRQSEGADRAGGVVLRVQGACGGGDLVAGGGDLSGERVRVAAGDGGVCGELLALLRGGVTTEAWSGAGVCGDLLRAGSRSTPGEQLGSGRLDGSLSAGLRAAAVVVALAQR